MAKIVIEKFTSDYSGEELSDDVETWTVTARSNNDPTKDRYVFDLSDDELQEVLIKPSKNVRTEKPRGRSASK